MLQKFLTAPNQVQARLKLVLHWFCMVAGKPAGTIN